MIDLKELGALVANILGGVAILAVIIFAAVAYLKQWGVQGKWLTGSAFAIGVVLAGVVRYAMMPAQTFADWVFTGLFGLMAGFLATGAYKGVEGVISKGAKTTNANYTITIPDQSLSGIVYQPNAAGSNETK